MMFAMGHCGAMSRSSFCRDAETMGRADVLANFMAFGVFGLVGPCGHIRTPGLWQGAQCGHLGNVTHCLYGSLVCRVNSQIANTVFQHVARAHIMA